MQTTERTQVERVEIDEDSFSVDVDLSASVSVEGLHEKLGEMADSFDVTGFKCAKCGLVHGHDTTKHRLSDSFDITEDEAAELEYDPVCHCGVQAAARIADDIGIDAHEAESVANSAPIPPEASRAMDDELGTL